MKYITQRNRVSGGERRCSAAGRRLMRDWADKEAETILDEFVENEGSDDLLKLHEAIVQALCHAYEMGKNNGKSV